MKNIHCRCSLRRLLIGAFAASHAKLPPPPAKSDAEKTGRGRQGRRDQGQGRRADLAKAQDKAVANYKKNKGAAMAPEQGSARSEARSSLVAAASPLRSPAARPCRACRMPRGAKATANLQPTKGSTVRGTVDFEQRGDKVRVAANVSGLRPERRVRLPRPRGRRLQLGRRHERQGPLQSARQAARRTRQRRAPRRRPAEPASPTPAATPALTPTLDIITVALRPGERRRPRPDRPRRSPTTSRPSPPAMPARAAPAP